MIFVLIADFLKKQREEFILVEVEEDEIDEKGNIIGTKTTKKSMRQAKKDKAAKKKSE